MELNRQQRRAAERRKQPVLAGIRIGDLTLKEAEVVEEALDQYALHLEELGDLQGERVWALGRARSIRDRIRASLENRPHYDAHGERTPA